MKLTGILFLVVVLTHTAIAQQVKGTRIFSSMRFYNDTASSIADSSVVEKYETGKISVYVMPVHQQQIENDSVISSSLYYRHFVRNADSAYGLMYSKQKAPERIHIDSVLKYMPGCTLSFDSLFAGGYRLLRSISNADSGTLHEVYECIQPEPSQHPLVCFIDYKKQAESLVENAGVLRDIERKKGLNVCGVQVFTDLPCAPVPTNVELRFNKDRILSVPPEVAKFLGVAPK